MSSHTKNIIYRFHAYAHNKGESVATMPASLLVVPFGEALRGIPPSLCGKELVGPNSLVEDVQIPLAHEHE